MDDQNQKLDILAIRLASINKDLINLQLDSQAFLDEYYEELEDDEN